MKKIMTVVALLATAAIAGGDIAPVEVAEVVVIEQSKDFYVGVSTTLGDSIAQVDYDSFSSTGYGINAGYTFYRTGSFETAVEARYAAVVTGSVDNFSDFQTYGAFIKPQYNFDMVSVYGLVGYTAVERPLVDVDGFAYGVGALVKVSDFEVFVDYVANNSDVFNGNDFDNEIVSVGVNYRF